MNEELIKYKLVRRDRTSSFIHPKSQFCRKYLKDMIVTADSQTIGIFIFETREDAERFKETRPLLILRVFSIGKEMRPKRISYDVRQRGLITFFKKPIYSTTKIPKGTICCPAVKVLD